MKYLFLIFLLVGCNTDYQVKQKTNEVCSQSSSQVTYVCEKVTPIFFWDVTLKYCKTMEECNDYCAEQAKK